MNTRTEHRTDGLDNKNLHRSLVQQARRAQSVNTRWQLLEAAHVVGQAQLKPHLQTHAMMLMLAWETHDLKELMGQLFRLVLVPIGHWLGRLPLGNPGRANVNAFKPMTVRPDLLALIQSARKANAKSRGAEQHPSEPPAAG
jgi:hypothetical protein